MKLVIWLPEAHVQLNLGPSYSFSLLPFFSKIMPKTYSGHAQEYSYQDAIGVMKEINDCKAILDLGSSSKVITSSGSSLANVEQENTVVKHDKHLTTSTSKKTLLDYMKHQAFD